MIHFLFFMIQFPTYPENHNIKISFCFLNQGTKANLFLALRLKTILMWCASCFYQNSNAVAVLAQDSFLQYTLESVFLVIHFSYGLFLLVQWYNTEDCFTTVEHCFKSVYFQELHCCVPCIIQNTDLVWSYYFAIFFFPVDVYHLSRWKLLIKHV